MKVCKYCNGTNKVDVYDPVSGHYLKGLTCPCKCEEQKIEVRETREPVTV